MNLPLLIGVGLFMFSAYMLKFAWANFNKAKASESWPSVLGQLTRVRLWGKRNIEGEMIDANRLSVAYEYQVDGKLLNGSRLAYFTLMYPDTHNYANSHTAESIVRVYYNPDEPEESVLFTGLRQDKPYSDLILAVVGVLTGACIALFV